MNEEITLTVSVESKGKRLDLYVQSPELFFSRSFIQTLIKDKLILVNNKSSKPSYKVKAGDKVLVRFPKFQDTNIEPEKIKLDVVFEDEDLIVINKPQGMVTHPASGIYTGTLVNALLYHSKDSLSGINGILRPGIVHRLDKETSGLIITCKNNKSHNDIAKQIKERTLKRHYLAIVHRKLQYEKGTINKPIGRHKTQRHKMAIVQGGRSAITHWKVLKRSEKFTLIECTLETGRTHQIRVHMASIGHPIVGDETYGKKNDTEKAMMLHAYKLVFTHPKSKKEIKLETEIPERFKKIPLSCL